MNCKITYSKDFLREFKHLRKRYRSLDEDLAGLLSDIRSDPFIGIDIGNNMRKIRLRVASKGRGKSGGARVITHTVIVSTQGTNVDKENISPSELRAILKEELLL